MSYNELKDTNEIKRDNRELINSLKEIDCSWFQNRDVSYDCCNTLAFLFTRGKLKGINKSEDLKIGLPGWRTDFKQMCEKDRDIQEREWERICDKIQGFAFFNSDGKHFDDLLYLTKLLGITIYISCPADITKFAETYQQPECQEILQDLIENNQIQFTSKDAVYSCENYFSSFNKVLVKAVIESLDNSTKEMNIF